MYCKKRIIDLNIFEMDNVFVEHLYEDEENAIRINCKISLNITDTDTTELNVTSIENLKSEI